MSDEPVFQERQDWLDENKPQRHVLTVHTPVAVTEFVDICNALDAVLVNASVRPAPDGAMQLWADPR